ncbi:MAG: tetratricopeptide repeat protein [Elusimicrobia bacterium]|nr:tetratricopeptide repeat protein [Elusimicrobiota bacterium]
MSSKAPQPPAQSRPGDHLYKRKPALKKIGWISIFFLAGTAAGFLAAKRPSFLAGSLARDPYRCLAGADFFPKNTQEFPSRQEIEGALSHAQKILDSNPTDLDALVVSGLAYYALGREHAVEALNRLESARDYGSADSRLPYYLGSLYNAVGLKQFAVTEYDRFLRNYPLDRPATMEAARLHFELGFYAQSAAFYERLMPQGKGKEADPLIVENLALVSLKLKDWEKARALLEDLRSRKKGYSKELSYFLAEALKGLGRCQEALAYYGEAMETSLDPSKEAVVLDGRLSCLNEIKPADDAAVEETAGRLIQLDPKNKSAKAALKKIKAKAKKPKKGQ